MSSIHKAQPSQFLRANIFHLIFSIIFSFFSLIALDICKEKAGVVIIGEIFFYLCWQEQNFLFYLNSTKAKLPFLTNSMPKLSSESHSSFNSWYSESWDVLSQSYCQEYAPSTQNNHVSEKYSYFKLFFFVFRFVFALFFVLWTAWAFPFY